MEGIDIEDDDIEYFVELTNIAGETCKVPVTADDPVTHSLLPKVRMEHKQKTPPCKSTQCGGPPGLADGKYFECPPETVGVRAAFYFC